MRYDSDRIFGRLRDIDSFVIGQLGQTLDGRVATESGESLYINGEDALTHLHRLRAAVDAVIVGVGTITADDPRLTVRLCDGDTPTRVVLDPADRMPADSQCLYDDNGSVIVVREKTPRRYHETPRWWPDLRRWHPRLPGQRRRYRRNCAPARR